MSTKKIREHLEIDRDVTEHADDPACPHCRAIEALVEVEAIERAAKVLAECKMSGTATEYDAALCGVEDVMLAIAKEAP